MLPPGRWGSTSEAQLHPPQPCLGVQTGDVPHAEESGSFGAGTITPGAGSVHDLGSHSPLVQKTRDLETLESFPSQSAAFGRSSARGRLARWNENGQWWDRSLQLWGSTGQSDYVREGFKVTPSWGSTSHLWDLGALAAGVKDGAGVYGYSRPVQVIPLAPKNSGSQTASSPGRSVFWCEPLNTLTAEVGLQTSGLILVFEKKRIILQRLNSHGGNSA